MAGSSSIRKTMNSVVASNMAGVSVVYRRSYIAIARRCVTRHRAFSEWVLGRWERPPLPIRWKSKMTKATDGTKVPHHGLFYMENAGGLRLSRTLLRQSQQTNVSPVASRWKMKKVKIGRAAARPGRKLVMGGLHFE